VEVADKSSGETAHRSYLLGTMIELPARAHRDEIAHGRSSSLGTNDHHQTTWDSHF
jgi:phosphoenolpyruvate synthase/pyruvate phosphate dikinase